MRLLHAVVLFSAVVWIGCAGNRPRVGPLADDFARYERDAEALGTSGSAADVLDAGREKRDTSRARSQHRKKDAYPLMMMAVADARLAVGMTRMEAAQKQADGCLRNVEHARQKWQEAFQRLEQTESVVSRASALPRQAPDWKEPAQPLPQTLLTGVPPPVGPDVDLEAFWEEWEQAAAARNVSAADLESFFRYHLSRSVDEKLKEAGREQHRYLAARALQSLECRVREEAADQTCVQAADLAVRLGDARDDALHATLELEHGLQDQLRDQLDQVRREARSRQSDLYDSLTQLEGKYARVTQEARGTIVSLADILFDFDKATLKRDVEFTLVRVATILNQFNEMKIDIEGHTDNVGTEEYNQKLSERRAQAVYEFLKSQGLDAGRMTYAGYGMSRPVADNDTEAGRQKNRRVDLVIRDTP